MGLQYTHTTILCQSINKSRSIHVLTLGLEEMICVNKNKGYTKGQRDMETGINPLIYLPMIIKHGDKSDKKVTLWKSYVSIVR